MLTTNEEAFKISEAERIGKEILIERLKNIGYIQEKEHDYGGIAVEGAYLSRGNVTADIKVRPYKEKPNKIFLFFGTKTGTHPWSELIYEVLEDRMVLTKITGAKPNLSSYKYDMLERGKKPTVLFD